MEPSLYRRPLPAETIAFSAPEGRQLFKEALSAGGLDGYFRLAEQFHTQSDPAFCGLGSLVVALNALAIDPGRLWKGPWRWFSEELLDCCVPLAQVRQRGLNLDELTCLARCNGAEVELQRADSSDLGAWRAAIAMAARAETVLVASYDRGAMGQTGSGHFSPVGGYHAASDRVLILDVARFKYPAHWVSAEQLWRAMQPPDPTTGRSRGWMSLRARAHGVSLGYSVRCEGDSWQGLAQRLTSTLNALAAEADLAALGRAILPLTAHVELRTPGAPAHQEALAAARAALREVPVYRQLVESVGPERAELVTLLLLVIADQLPAQQRALIPALPNADHPALGTELSNLRAQFGAVLAHAGLGGVLERAS
jgi:glutathione gamma-glutamylcysteinyltransferase